MAVGEGVVAVGGYGSTSPFRSSRDWVVNTYDERSGRLLWSDHLGDPKFIDEGNGGMVVAGGRAIAFGITSDPSGTVQWMVRSYDARRGQVLWQDRVVQGNLKSGPFGIVIGLAASGGRVTAVGAIDVPYANFTGFEWIVRTYAVGNAEDKDDAQAERSESGDQDRR